MTGPLPPFDTALILRIGSDVVYAYGDVDRAFPLALVTKPIIVWSMLVTVKRGLISLDNPADPEDPTIRRLLAHALGLPFGGCRPVAVPEKRRIYPNEGFDVLDGVIEAATGVGTVQWVREAIFGPLGMVTADIPSNPARTGVANASGVGLSGTELACPMLLSGSLAVLATLSQFPVFAGAVLGYGHFSPCLWGLDLEARGEESPHWTVPSTSPRTIGHFGQSDSFV